MPSTVVFAEIEMAVVLESANVAVSADPFGTVAGVQFVAIFQSAEVGLRSHVALPPRARPARKNIRPQPITGSRHLLQDPNLGFAGVMEVGRDIARFLLPVIVCSTTNSEGVGTLPEQNGPPRFRF